MNALLKKLYVDWGLKRGLTPERQMRIIRYMHRDSPNVSIGEKCNFQAFNNIDIVEPTASMHVGSFVSIAEGTRMSALGPGKLTIGSRCMFGSGGKIFCRDKITIGDYCLASWGVVIADYEGHPIHPKERIGQMDYMMAQFNPHVSWDETGLSEEQKEHFDTYWEDASNYPHAPVTIGRNVWIGQNVSIIRGSTIGDNAIIGARSVVLGDIPANSIVLGRPARPIKKDVDQEEREEYWKKSG